MKRLTNVLDNKISDSHSGYLKNKKLSTSSVEETTFAISKVNNCGENEQRDPHHLGDKNTVNNDSVDEAALWTIPEYIIALCANDDDDHDISKALDGELTVIADVDSDRHRRTKEAGDVKSNHDDCLVQTCFNEHDTKDVSITCT